MKTPGAIFSTTTTTADQTRALAALVAPKLKAGDVVLLNANLGCGKTVFVQGLVKALGFYNAALSPTFVMAHTYPTTPVLHHLDFYRLTKKEILEAGLDEYIYGKGEIDKGIAVVEWANRCMEIWPKQYLEISISLIPKSTTRKFIFQARGRRFEKIVKGLQ